VGSYLVVFDPPFALYFFIFPAAKNTESKSVKKVDFFGGWAGGSGTPRGMSYAQQVAKKKKKKTKIFFLVSCHFA
jgi:hypothetical protein